MPRSSTRRTRHVALTVTVASLVLANGCGRDDSAAADKIAARFVEQVNTNTCDDPSGVTPEQRNEPSSRSSSGSSSKSSSGSSANWDSVWSEACRAAVDDLAPDTKVSETSTSSSSSGEIGRSYQATSTYTNRQDLNTVLTIDFEGTGVWADKAALDQISSLVVAGFGWDSPHMYRQAEVDPAAEEFVANVEALLAHGDCAELESLLAPADEFGPAPAVQGDCESIARLVDNNGALGSDSSTSTSTSIEESAASSWTAAVYSTIDLFGSHQDNMYGIPRQPNESQFDYADRVLAAIETTNLLATKSSPFADGAGAGELGITAVLFDGDWYLANITYHAQPLLFEFPS